MSDVFISYDRDDALRVAPLAAALAQRGWSVWWDREIRTGQEFESAIAAALESAGCVIVIWSLASIRSPFVKEEAKRGLRREVLLPVRFDAVEPPLPFGGVQTLDLIGWDGTSRNAGFDQLVEDVARTVGNQGRSEPAPGATPIQTIPAALDATQREAAIASRRRWIVLSGLAAAVAVAGVYFLRSESAPDPASELAHAPASEPVPESLSCPTAEIPEWSSETPVTWPTPDDSVALELGRCNALWKERSQRIARGKADAATIAAQTDCAMRRLVYVHLREGEKWSDLPDEVAPLLHQSLEHTSGARAADLLAHLGWADFLKSRDGIGDLYPDAYYHRALQSDPDNPFANAMWGHWILWRNGPIADARERFFHAVASGRERALVRYLQLPALREQPVELIRVADEMRRNGEPVPTIDHDRGWSLFFDLYYHVLLIPSGEPDRDPFLAALAATDHLATFRWLFPVNQLPDDKRKMWVLFLATLQERSGDAAAARSNLSWLCAQLANEGAKGGPLVSRMQESLQRLPRGA